MGNSNTAINAASLALIAAEIVKWTGLVSTLVQSGLELSQIINNAIDGKITDDQLSQIINDRDAALVDLINAK